MKRKGSLLILLLMMVLLFAACKKEDDFDKDKIRDLEYTVCDVSNLPEIVVAKIETEMVEPFKFSYSDGEYQYVAIGYGEQPTSDYSIQVVAFYESENYIVIRTKLLGPAETDKPVTTPTYPFIVIKTPDLGKSVCYK